MSFGTETATSSSQSGTRFLDRWEKSINAKHRALQEKTNVLEADRERRTEKERLHKEQSQRDRQEIFQSAMQTWSDVLTTLSQGSLPPEQRQLYLDILRSRGVLIDKSTEITVFLPRLQTALINQYGAKIGRQRIISFFQNFNPSDIIVARTEEVVKAGQDLTSFGNKQRREFESQRKERGELKYEPTRAGFHAPFQGIVMVGYSDEWNNPNAKIDFEVTLSEEIIHNLLEGSNKRGIITLFRNSKKLVSAIRGFEVHNYSMDYHDRPDEQIAKGVVLNLFHELRPDAHPSVIYDPYSLSAAKKGQLRANELGWSKILRHNYRTNHEEDFWVNRSF